MAKTASNFILMTASLVRPHLSWPYLRKGGNFLWSSSPTPTRTLLGFLPYSPQIVLISSRAKELLLPTSTQLLARLWHFPAPPDRYSPLVSVKSPQLANLVEPGKMTIFLTVTRFTVVQSLRSTMGLLYELTMLHTTELLASNAMLDSHSQVATHWSPSHVWRTAPGVLFLTVKVSSCVCISKSLQGLLTI